MVSGTAFLISRIGTSGYKYYMATNMHVIQNQDPDPDAAFNTIMDGGSYSYIHIYNYETYYKRHRDFAVWLSDQSTRIASVKFDPKLAYTQYYDFGSQFGEDYTFLEVDFGAAAQSGSVKTNLDAFNVGNSQKGLPAGKIKGVNTAVTNAHINTPKYVGGFPYNVNQYA
jgi:hypothetical protein